jgi:hypothetical protein
LEKISKNGGMLEEINQYQLYSEMNGERILKVMREEIFLRNREKF